MSSHLPKKGFCAWLSMMALVLLASSHVNFAQYGGFGQTTMVPSEKPVDELIVDLKSGDGHQIYGTFRALAKMGSQAEPAIPQLVTFLREPKAVFKIADFPDPRGIFGGIPSFRYAEMSKETLVAIGPTAAPYLLKALADNSPELQLYSAKILGYLAWDKKLDPAVDPQAVTNALSKYLQTNASRLSISDLEAVGFAKPPEATKELILRLQTSSDFQTRADCALTLGTLKATDAMDALKKALAEDPNGLVRGWSAKGLSGLRQPDATSGAIAAALLADKEPVVRECCAQALLGVRTPEAIKALILALGDDDAEVRRSTAQAFRQVKSKEAVPALIKALEKEIKLQYMGVSQIADEMLIALAKQGAVEALPLIDQILKNNKSNHVPMFTQFAFDVLSGKIQLEKSEQAN